MAAIIMPLGTSSEPLPTDWLTVSGAEEHAITCIGESGAELMIEQRIGATSNGQTIGKAFVSSSRPEAAIFRIKAPFIYRIVRPAGITAGAQIEPESSSGGGS
jgi:hypothetical protein